MERDLPNLPGLSHVPSGTLQGMRISTWMWLRWLVEMTRPGKSSKDEENVKRARKVEREKHRKTTLWKSPLLLAKKTQKRPKQWWLRSSSCLLSPVFPRFFFWGMFPRFPLVFFVFRMGETKQRPGDIASSWICWSPGSSNGSPERKEAARRKKWGGFFHWVQQGKP